MVKCVEYGYLACRDRNGEGALEATEQTRSFGHGKLKTEKLFCYKSSATSPLVPIKGQLPPSPERAIRFDVVCESYTPWLKGRTPKEHEDMTTVERVQTMYAASAQALTDIQQRLAEHNEAMDRREMSLQASERRARIWSRLAMLIAALSAAGTIWNACTNYSRTATVNQDTDPARAIAPPVP